MFVIALAAFTLGLRNREILMIDTRFALFCHELLERGGAPFPWLYGQLYPDYTSWPMLLTAWCARWFGEVNQLAIVLPSAVAGALVVVVTAAIGDRMRGLYYGVAAAGLLFGAFEFVSIGRIVSLDLYVALATALCFLLCLLGDSGTLRDWRWRIWIFALLTFSFLMRGPIGLVIPAAVVFAFDLLERRWLRAVATGTAGAVLLLILLFSYAGLARSWGGDEFLAKFWEMQITGRLSSTRPAWYYFADAAGSFAFTYPAGLLVLVLYWYYAGRRLWSAPNPDLRQVRLLGGWLLIVVLGLSIPGTKHLRYITPVIPAAALLAARLLTDFDPAWRGLRRLQKCFFTAAFWLPVAAMAGLLGAGIILRLPAVVELIGGRVEFPLIGALPALAVLAAVAVTARKRPEPVRRLLLTLAAAGVIYCGRVAVAEPVDQATLSSKAFVAACEERRPDGVALWFFALGPDGDENKYMVHVERSRQFIPEYLPEDPAGLARIPSGTLVVARREKFEKLLPEEFRLRCEMLTSGRLARRQCSLYRVR